MYRTHHGNGMGAIDWGGIINSGIQAGAGVVSDVWGSGSIPAVNPQYPADYPSTYTQQAGFGGTDWASLAALGIGAFLIISMIKPKRRR